VACFCQKVLNMSELTRTVFSTLSDTFGAPFLPVLNTLLTRPGARLKSSKLTISTLLDPFVTLATTNVRHPDRAPGRLISPFWLFLLVSALSAVSHLSVKSENKPHETPNRLARTGLTLTTLSDKGRLHNGTTMFNILHGACRNHRSPPMCS